MTQLNESIVIFEDNSSASVISLTRTRGRANLPINLLGKNRNDYQDLGLTAGEYELQLYTYNESQYTNLIKDLYKQGEIKMQVDGFDFYVVPTSIHKTPIQAGMIEDKYILTVSLTATDPLRYKTNTTKYVALINITGESSDSMFSVGDLKTPCNLNIMAYDLNSTVVSFIASETPQNITAAFGRKDSLGFDHLKWAAGEIPEWGNDDNGNFWSNFNYWSNYILPPLNMTYGNCTYQYAEWWEENCAFMQYDYKNVGWRWGLDNFLPFNIYYIKTLVYKNDGQHWISWPTTIGYDNFVIPKFYWTGRSDYRCKIDFEDSRKSWGCYEYWPEEGMCLNDVIYWCPYGDARPDLCEWRSFSITGYQLFYGEKWTGDLGSRVSAALGGLFINLDNDYNFDKISIDANINLKIINDGSSGTCGSNIYVYNNVNHTFQPLKIAESSPRWSSDIPNEVTLNITQGNYSSDWNISGGFILLFMTQITSGADEDYDLPWAHYLGSPYITKNGKTPYGTDYLRARIFRNNHKLSTVIKRNYEKLKYIIIDGINNIENNTVVVDFVNASNGVIGDFIYKTDKVAGNNWSNSHVFNLLSLNYMSNLSYYGVVISLEDELEAAETLPLVRLYNYSDSQVYSHFGGNVTIDAGSDGYILENPTYYNNNSFQDKTFVKEYAEFETLTKIELYNNIEPDRKAYLQTPFIIGEYQLQAHKEDRYIFNAFENLTNSYIEKSGDITFENSSIILNSNFITYLISANNAFIDYPIAYIAGNVSSCHLSGDGIEYFEIPLMRNTSFYLGSSDIDLRGYERFYIRLTGGVLSAFSVYGNLGTIYNPLPFIFPDYGNILKYSKDKNINATLLITFDDAYY